MVWTNAKPLPMQAHCSNLSLEVPSNASCLSLLTKWTTQVLFLTRLSGRASKNQLKNLLNPSFERWMFRVWSWTSSVQSWCVLFTQGCWLARMASAVCSSCIVTSEMKYEIYLVLSQIMRRLKDKNPTLLYRIFDPSPNWEFHISIRLDFFSTNKKSSIFTSVAHTKILFSEFRKKDRTGKEFGNIALMTCRSVEPQFGDPDGL